MTQYEPTIAQMAYGNDWGEFAMDDYEDALLVFLLREIERVYWNIHQEEWEYHTDPEIPGLTYRPYYWGDDDDEAAKPNLVLDSRPDVEIRWYKYPIRGTSVNKRLSPDEWKDWLDAALAVVRGAEDLVP